MRKIRSFRWALMAFSALVGITPAWAQSTAISPTPPPSDNRFTAPGLVLRNDRFETSGTIPTRLFMSLIPSPVAPISCSGSQGCNPSEGTIIDPFYNPGNRAAGQLRNGPGDLPELCRIVDNTVGLPITSPGPSRPRSPNASPAAVGNIMVPYNSVAEWVAFILNTPPNVVAYPCCRQVPVRDLLAMIINPQDALEQFMRTEYLNNSPDPAEALQIANYLFGVLTAPGSKHNEWYPYSRFGDSYTYTIEAPDPNTSSQIDEFTITATCLPTPVQRPAFIQALQNNSNTTMSGPQIATALGSEAVRAIQSGLTIAHTSQVSSAAPGASGTNFIGGVVSKAMLTSSFGGNSYLVEPGNIYIGGMANGTGVVSVPGVGLNAGTGGVVMVGRDGNVILMGPATTPAARPGDPLGTGIAYGPGDANYLTSAEPTAPGVFTAAGGVIPFFNSGGDLTAVGQSFLTGLGPAFGLKGVGLAGSLTLEGGSAGNVLTLSQTNGGQFTLSNGLASAVTSAVQSAANSTSNGTTTGAVAVIGTTSFTSSSGFSPVFGVNVGGAFSGQTPSSSSVLTAVIVNADGSLTLVLGGPGTGSSSSGIGVNVSGGFNPTATTFPVVAGGIGVGSGPQASTISTTGTFGPGTTVFQNPSLNITANPIAGSGSTLTISQIGNLGCVSNCPAPSQPTPPPPSTPTPTPQPSPQPSPPTGGGSPGPGGGVGGGDAGGGDSGGGGDGGGGGGGDGGGGDGGGGF